ncbi:MAG: hypothetical protein GEU26_05400 [Nitrososphaeraceae archaeon]|nr:hypothetical protein [Nitrososphaeraceae archaeon]
MTVELLHNSRIEIITRWLKGEQRDKISAAMGLGAGTISAIISEWKAEIGIPNADTLRQFSTELRRLGITASQCVLGCRILGVLRKLRVDEENLESFVSQVYQRCQSKSITPQAIVDCSQEILSMAEKTPISRIPQIVQTMIVEKQKLEQELSILRRDQATAKKEREEALKNSKIAISNINEFIGLKDMLSKSGLSFDNLPEINKLARVLYNVKECLYEPRTITTKLSAIDNLQERQLELQDKVVVEEQRLNKTVRERVENENRLSLCQMCLGLYDQLESMECGLKELTMLRNTIFEISKSNNIHPQLAFKKFCSDIEDQYDAKLGFEKRIEEMNKSLIDAQQEFRSISLECSKLKDIHVKLGELFEYGVSQSDIVYWNNIVKGYTRDPSSMNEDLLQYGGLVNARTQLESIVKALRLEEEHLTDRVKVLKEEAKKISLSIKFEVSLGIRLIQIFLKDLEAKIAESNKATEESLRSVKQQSMSIAEQTVKSLQTLDANTKQQLDLFQKIGATAEFSPLVKAARGQYVDREDLKVSVIRAMGIMHSRLNYMLNSRTQNKLQEAIEELESEILVS